jgi:hypothetical protein
MVVNYASSSVIYNRSNVYSTGHSSNMCAIFIRLQGRLFKTDKRSSLPRDVINCHCKKCFIVQAQNNMEL